jgi:hypothetical protein
MVYLDKQFGKKNFSEMEMGPKFCAVKNIPTVSLSLKPSTRLVCLKFSLIEETAGHSIIIS